MAAWKRRPIDPMFDEIKKIMETDEAAWEKVQAARVEADGIRSHAQRRAEEIASGGEKKLAASVDAERERILAEAQSRADQTIEETNRYIDSLQEKKSVILSELVGNLLDRVVST